MYIPNTNSYHFHGLSLVLSKHTGTRIGQPVQMFINIGHGVVDLIKIPVSEYNKGGNVWKGKIILYTLFVYLILFCLFASFSICFSCLSPLALLPSDPPCPLSSFLLSCLFALKVIFLFSGIGAGASSLAQRVTVEVLNLSASSAITIKKGLTSLDKAITGSRPAVEDNISDYANQPENLLEG